MGTLDEQMRALELIVSKLAEDPYYSESMNSPFSYPGLRCLLMPRNIKYPFFLVVTVASLLCIV